MSALAHDIDPDHTEAEAVQGAYVYGIVRARDWASSSVFHQPPLPGAETPHIVWSGERGVIVSPMIMGEIDPTRRNMMAHTKVLEEAMAMGPVLPVRFGTLADRPEALSTILDDHGTDLDTLFARIAGRVELGVKVFWNMERLFAEIGEEDSKIRQLREKLAGTSEAQSYYQRIDLGRRIEDALAVKREQEAAALMALLSPLAEETRTPAVTEDRMVLNGAFLVEAAREAAFDAVVEDIRTRQEERVTVRYVGPVPPYSFITLSIDWSPAEYPAFSGTP
ncbi:MAG: GvpL/GvpF family gas vesicle protein [Alphaproteobacteria bacterium]